VDFLLAPAENPHECLGLLPRKIASKTKGDLRGDPTGAP
jgi:hypothetical protein